jgi:hypothetical protein
LAAGTLAALGLAELGLRRLTIEQRGFRYKDGVWSQPKEFEADRTRNRLGFHDANPGPKQPGTTRVLLLGDSYVAALTVPVRQTVGRRLQKALRGTGDPSHDVIALGKYGWGQADELDALQKLGDSLQPDLVVTLFLTLNDVRNNSDVLQERAERQIAQGRFFRPGLIEVHAEHAPLFLFEGSVLNQWISYRLGLLRLRRAATEIPVDYFVYAREASEEWEAAWAATEDLLRRTRELSRELGADYAVVSASTPQGVLGPEEGLRVLERQFPLMREHEWDLDLPDRRLAAFLRDEGIPFLALEPLFRAATREGGTFHWPRDGHWNRDGNELAAQEIAELVRSL